MIEPLQARLLRQAAALTGDLSLAEDIVSETLVEAWKSFPRYNESCQLSTWLYAILLHRYQKSLRRARSRPIAAALLSLFEARDFHQKQENIVAPELSPAEATAQNETFARLRQCIELLPKKHARVVLLRFFEDATAGHGGSSGLFHWHGKIPPASRPGKIAQNENEPSRGQRG
ncbi:MAG: RNA polymerase sigma factor [Limisphaerales bacterium]